jgi:putative ABC transport system permease protein
LDRLMQEGPRVSAVDVRVDPSAAAAFYRSLKATPAIAGVTLWRVALQGFRDTMEETMHIIVTFYVAFGTAIAFGVAYNSARIALSERGRELATLRVIGFTRFEVSYILLGEMALLLLPALPLGCAVGYGLTAMMVEKFSSDLFRIPLVIESSTYAFACLVTIVATTLSGLLVRRRIDRLDLVAVLKTRE